MMDQQNTSSDPNARAGEFQPDQGGNDTTSGEALLVAAYVVMWLLIFLFVWQSWRRQIGLSERLTRLEKALAQSSAGAPGGSGG